MQRWPRETVRLRALDVIEYEAQKHRSARVTTIYNMQHEWEDLEMLR